MAFVTLGMAGHFIGEAFVLLAAIAWSATDFGWLLVKLCVGKAQLSDVKANLLHSHRSLLALYDTCEALTRGELWAAPAGCEEPPPPAPPAAADEEPATARQPAPRPATVTPLNPNPECPAAAAATPVAAAAPAAPAVTESTAAAAATPVAAAAPAAPEVTESTAAAVPAGGVAAAPAGGLAEGGRLQSFQLRDEDLFGVSLSSENGIPSPSSSDADAGDDSSQLLGDFPAALESALPKQGAAPAAAGRTRQVPPLVLPAAPPASAGPSSDYGTPRSQQGSDASSFFTTSEYSELLLSPRSDAGANAKWVAAHPLSALNQAVSECSEEDRSVAESETEVNGEDVKYGVANGDAGDDVSDVVVDRKKRGLRLGKVLLRPEAGGKHGKQRGLLKRLFGKKTNN